MVVVPPVATCAGGLDLCVDISVRNELSTCMLEALLELLQCPLLSLSHRSIFVNNTSTGVCCMPPAQWLGKVNVLFSHYNIFNKACR